MVVDMILDCNTPHFVQELPRYATVYMETWWSGLTYLFAKEADLSKGLEGSNPSVSAK